LTLNHAHLSKAGARLFEFRRKSSTLTKWIDSTMRVAAIGLHKQVSVVSVFAFEKEAFSTKEAKVNLFNDARFRLISSNSEQIHFLYSDVSSASDDDSEAFFRANSRPKIASICRSGFEILNEFYLGDLNCKEEDFDFPIFVDAVETELHIFGIFQSRARKYQKNAICRFVKADLGNFQKNNNVYFWLVIFRKIKAVSCSESDAPDDLSIRSRSSVNGELVMSPRDSSEYGAFNSITVDAQKTENFPLIFIGN
jgi:hypothetical protein